MLKKIGIVLGILLVSCFYLNSAKASAEVFDWLREDLRPYARKFELPRPNGSLSFEGKGAIYSLEELEGFLTALYERNPKIPPSVRDFLSPALKALYALGIPAHPSSTVNSGFVCMLKRLEDCDSTDENYAVNLVTTANKTLGFHGGLVGQKFGTFSVIREHCAACLKNPETRQELGLPVEEKNSKNS